MSETYSTTKANALNTLGTPTRREVFDRGKEKIEWACGCSFDETDQGGSGVLFACEKHSR